VLVPSNDWTYQTSKSEIYIFPTESSNIKACPRRRLQKVRMDNCRKKKLSDLAYEEGDAETEEAVSDVRNLDTEEADTEDEAEEEFEI